MPFITWDESLSVGVGEMDEQHKKFIDIINELNDAMRVGKGSAILMQILQKLSDYTTYHFNAEEMLLQKHEYIAIVEHVKEHRAFKKKVEEYVAAFQKNQNLLSLDVMNTIKLWLIDHIQKIDKKYTKYVVPKSQGRV